MKDVLETLNVDQLSAAQELKRDVLLIGGAGCGKTRTILHKIAHILQKGKHKPGEILVLSSTRFTQQYVQRELVGLDIPEDIASAICYRTFCELGLEVIRRNPEGAGVNGDFSVYDPLDCTAIIEQACIELKIPAKLTPRSIHNRILQAKAKRNEGGNFFTSLASGNPEFHNAVELVYNYYASFLERHQALDYEDVLHRAVQLLDADKRVLSHFTRRSKFIFVDEYQDLTQAQYSLVRRMHGKSSILTVAGNDDQCVVEGTPILTPEGVTKIENLTEGQSVMACIGGGHLSPGTVSAIKSRSYSGSVVRITFDRGKTLRVTPNHILFARFDLHAKLNYLYLMLRPGLGARIGISQGLSFFTEPRKFGLREGDRFFILSIHDDINEARFEEALLSARYGIPNLPFSIQGTPLSLNNKQLEELYRRLDTTSRAELLMEELHLLEEYPHHISVVRTRTEEGPRVLSVTMFGHREREKNEGWYPHRIRLDTQRFGSTGDTDSGEHVEWVVDATRRDYGDIMRFARTLAEMDNLMIVERARLTSKGSFFQTPASHVKAHMFLPVLVNNRVQEMRVKSVEFEEYDGPVFDLTVDNLHNFIAADVVVHNSIHSWRGSDLMPLVNFSKDFKNSREIKLERNYRSTKSILWSANELVRNNINRIEKNVWTDNEMGERIVCYKALNEQDEVYYAINQMRQLIFREEKQYRHFSFLFRTYAQSKILEDILRKEGIPFTLIGDDSPFLAREIKDILAYLKVLTNHADNYSLLRILNVPRRGIGEKSIECLDRHSLQNKLPIWDCLGLVNEIDGLPLKSKNTILNFRDLLEDLARDIPRYSVRDFIETVVERSGYFKELKSLDAQGSAEVNRRMHALYEAASVADAAGKNLREFLGQVSLVDRQADLDLEKNSVLLSPIHETIGLEHPVVFILGMEEGVFPNDAPSYHFFDVEEERRVLYQAMMRGRERLFLINAQVRRIFGSVFENCPSRFLEEFPEELVIHLDSELVKEHMPENQKPQVNRPCIDSEYGLTFTEGDRVKHSMWGIGKVIETAGEDEDLMVTVDFMNAGVKKLLIKYAPLERI